MERTNRKPPRMTGEEYHVTLATLGLSVVSGAQFLGISRAQSWRYSASGNVPSAVAMLLRLMVAIRLTPEAVTRKIARG